MRKQRVRTLKELYEITQQLLEPEITPVLEGRCRIQGPVDEVDLDIETNLAVLPTEKGFGKYYSDEDIHMKASGTCNVCAAPCSSCMHFNRAISFMESKAEVDISENSCGRKEADTFSFSNSGIPSFCKSKPCDDHMQAASEASKIFSTTSSHDSYSENAESKATVRTPDVHDASEDVDMPLKVTSFETVEENQLLVERNDNSPLPQEPTGPNMVQRTSSSLQGDHHGFECHGDNISCVTGQKDVNVAASDPSRNLGRKKMPCTSASTRGLLGQGLKMTAQAQAADGEIVDVKSIPHKAGKFTKEPSQTRGAASDSLNSGFLHNHFESSSLNDNPSPKEQFLNSNSKIGNSFWNNDGSKDVEEDSSPQIQAQHSESILEPEKSPLGRQMKASALDEQKSKSVSHATDFANYESSKASSAAFEVSSPRDAYQCLGTQTGLADGNPTDDSTKYCMLNEQHGKPSSSSDTPNLQGPQSESKPTLDGDGPDPESLEDDVKVCDICGDAGREDLLAICSRCSDGAEHIYCMRIMLDKVPEGDWFCEECMLKDEVTDKMDKSQTVVTDKMEKSETKMEKSETKMEKSETVVTDKMDKSETVLGTLKALCPNEKVQKVGSTSNPKLLPKLDISTNDAEVPLVVKGLKSPQVSAKRPTSIADIVSQSNKRHSDSSGAPAMAASPSKKFMLSRESSFKNLDAGKGKQGNFASPSASQSCNISQVPSRSLAPGPNSSRVQGPVQSPRCSLSKSSSFNSLKPKVKQVTENVPQKSQVIKEYATSDVKEAFARTLSKSASCKHINSGNSNIIESTIKSQSANPHRSEDSRNPRQGKERITEKKNSVVFNRTLPSSLQASAPSVSFSKADSKVVQNDGKVNSLSEPNASYPSKGLDDAHDKGLTELKKQSSHASKTCGVHASNGASNLADQRPAQIALREDAHIGSSGEVNTVPQRVLSHLSNRDEKLKDSSTFGGSRSSTLPPKRILRCQRCNETGHSTQFCSVDKVRVSALKPSAERSSREATNKGSKWKDAVDAAISKVRMQKNFPDQSEEVSSTDISSEIVSQNHSSSSSSCVKDLPTVEGTADKQNGLRSSTADISKTTVNDVKQHAPLLMGTVCTSKDGESNAISHGAELKTKTSPQIQPEIHSVPFDPLRVSALPDHEYIWQGSFEVKRAGRLPELCDGIQAHLSTCASPKVRNVVNKFSDKVHLEEVARLSSWPLQFQENNPTEENIALFFFAKDVPSYQKSYSKLLENMLENDVALKANFDGIELLIFPSSKLPEKSQRWNQLFFLWGVFRERTSHCSGTPSGLHSKSSISNFNLEHVVRDLPTQLVTEVAASEKESSHKDMNKDTSRHDKSINTEGTSNQGAPDSNLHPGRSSLDSNAAPDFLASELTDLHDISPKSRIQKNTAQLCLEVKDNSTCQNESITGSDGRKDDVLPVSVRNSSLQNVHSHGDGGLSAVHMITSNPGPPDLNMDSQDMDDVYSEPTVKYQCSSLPVLGASAVVESNYEKIKEIGRLTEKGTASDSVITVDKTQDMQWIAGLPNKKRARSHSPEHGSESFDEASVGTKTECILLDDDERESKKVRVHLEAPACSGSGVDIFGDKMSSKVHPLLANFLNEQTHLNKSLHGLPPLPESSKKSERYFFPIDSGSAMDAKSGSLIPLQILSSDDEYECQQESDTPNLELALGAEKRPVKPEILPMPFPMVTKDKNKGKLPDPTAEDGDDDSASLSLSLAFPFTGKERAQMPIPKTEQLLPKRPQVNTSLLLFGRFTDS